MGGDTARSRLLSGRQDELGDAARLWVQLTGLRKDLLFRCSERKRVAAQIVTSLAAEKAGEFRAILFHERVDQATELYGTWRRGCRTSAWRSSILGSDRAAHPRPAHVRKRRDTGAGVGEILGGGHRRSGGRHRDFGRSTTSVRQRVQALGRVLRRSVGATGESKVATMHLIYVRDTVDDLIYGKADWSDLTGAEANNYWEWPWPTGVPERVDGPPRSPKPTEEQAWQLLGEPIEGLPATGQESWPDRSTRCPQPVW